MNKRVEEEKPFKIKEIKILMKAMMKAVSCMHEQNIVHCDLKPCILLDTIFPITDSLVNILLEDPNDLTSIQICDFGLSR